MLLQSLMNWSKRSPAALFACQGRANAHLDRRWLYLRSKGLTEGTVPPHGPLLAPVYPGQHRAPLRPPCRSSPGLPCVENVPGGKCLPTPYTPQAEGKAACRATGGYCPPRVRAKTFLLHFMLHVPFISIQKCIGGLD